MKNRWIIFVLLLLTFVLVVSCDIKSPESAHKDLSTEWGDIWLKAITIESCDEVVFDYLFPENYKLSTLKSDNEYEYIIKNNGNKEETIVVYLGDANCNYKLEKGYLCLKIEAGESVNLKIKTVSTLEFPYCGLCVNDNNMLYVVDNDSFELSVYDSYINTMIFVNDIYCRNNVVLSDSKVIINNEHKLNILADFGILSSEEIDVSIWNSDSSQLYCHNFYADAELCDLYINEEFFEFKYGREFSLSVKSYNGINFHPNVKKITSKTMLEVLLDKDEYPILKDNMTINLSSGLNLSGIFSMIDKPCTIVLEGEISSITKLKVAFDKIGDIVIKCIGDYSVGADLFSIDAPNANLTTIGCDIVIADVVDNFNLLSFNGMMLSDSVLGGDGNEKLTSVSLLKTNNRNITEDIIWSLDGYVFSANVSSVLDPDVLNNAVLSLQSSGDILFSSSCVNDDGTIDLLSDTGCFVTVTDDDGNSVRYVIKTIYVPTKLPVVVIDVDNDAIIESETEYLGATIKVNCNYLNGEFPSLSSSRVNIRGRGNSTWTWDKKPYKIRFDTKTSVLGMTANKNWTLIANYADKSLIRNSLAMYMSSILDGMPFSMHQYPVDLFLNGEYMGVYTLGEQIEAKTDRVDIEIDDNVNVLDTGYLLQIGGTTSEDVWNVTCFKTSLLRYVKIEDPIDDILTVERVKFIKDYCLAADAAVIAGVGYEEYIDIDALCDWVIMIELSYNLDSCFHRSVFMTKQAGGKLQMGPVWDFDLAFGNMSRDKNNYRVWVLPGVDDEEAYIKLNWLNYLYTNESFCDALAKRWNDVKEQLLNKSLAYIDELYNKVSPSAKYNFEVWDILGKKVAFEPSYTNKYDTYEKQINYLKSFLKDRWKWIDDNIEGGFPLIATENE